MADWTSEDLETINDAIASGALEVEYNDRRVKYRSMNELMKARELIRKSLGLTKKTGTVYATASKGTC